jgi:hypothetical protein
MKLYLTKILKEANAELGFSQQPNTNFSRVSSGPSAPMMPMPSSSLAMQPIQQAGGAWLPPDGMGINIGGDSSSRIAETPGTNQISLAPTPYKPSLLS